MAIDDQLGARARRHRSSSLQVARWRGDARVAVLTPTPNGPGPDAAAVAYQVQRLTERGVDRILTGALHHDETEPFAANGFEVHDRLHLLRHDLVDLPRPPRRVALRRAGRRHLASVLRIDREAFDDFWTLDRQGIRDALAATPSSRFRVSREARGTVTGYSITGRAGDRSYLQRLAVDPRHHGEGLGTALVVDALAWARHGRAKEMIVNTQLGNELALGLYRRCGFVPEDLGLTVLHLDVGRPAPS